MKRPFLPLALAACSLVSVAPVFAQTVTTPATIATLPAGVAADVNGDKIMMADVNRMLASYKSAEPSFQTGSPAAEKALTEVRRGILDALIDSRLLLQEAKRTKVTVKPADIDSVVDGLRKRFATPKEFTDSLAKDGKTEADLRKLISDQLTLGEFSKQVTSDIVVSNDDIAQFYKANPDQFKIPEGVRARHILLAINPSAPPAEKERVKKRALDLIKQLKGGADFATLAKTNSDDPGTKTVGGDLGAFTRGQMVKPFEDAAFAATKGQIVGPVETEFGIHIIKVEEKLPAGMMPLSDAQKIPGLKAHLLKQKVQARLDQTVAALRQKGKITKSSTI